MGVAEGGHRALEVGAGLGSVGLAAFGHGTCLHSKEGRAGAAPAQSVSGEVAPADGSNRSEEAGGGRTRGDNRDRGMRHQLAACTYAVLPGPRKLLRWTVPASRGHDDLLISTALTSRLDEMDWRDRTARGR